VKRTPLARDGDRERYCDRRRPLRRTSRDANAAASCSARSSRIATPTRLDSASGEGTDLDLEEDLGLESSMSVARIAGYYWLTPRQRLDAGYFDLSRSATNPTQEEIRFGDRTFEIDTVIETENDLRILKADYTFAVLARERGYLGITGGLYVAEMTMTLSAPRLGSSESEGLTAPLPVVGLRGDYAITDRFTLRGAAQWFALETDDVDGTLRDICVGADYGLGDRMAIGLAYNLVAMGIAAQEEHGFRGSVDWGYDGLLLYFKLAFGP
jgi:hypothetical protein